MKNLTLIVLGILLSNNVFASNFKCDSQVKEAIEGKEMYNVVEKINSKDGLNYVVVFRTASGDAEEASVAVVTTNSNCEIKNIRYVKGDH